MSANTTAYVATVLAKPDAEKKHVDRLRYGALLGVAAVIAMAVYGGKYYTLSAAERPFSPKHEVLRPGGSVGLKLGILGVVMFCGLFAYAVRKHVPWLRKRGNSQHWLDYHVLLGIGAPVLIAFHSSFKFRGIAGFAFWVMVAVSISGFVGRYLYGQMPRRATTAKSSLKESHEMQLRLAWGLAGQRLIPASDLRSLLFLPTYSRMPRWPLLASLIHMVTLDLKRPFHIARLRRKFMGTKQKLVTVGGLLPGANPQVERAIALARDQAKLCKRIEFFSRAQQIFRLWHVVHKPFSYAFGVLVLIHIAVAMLLGFV